MKKNGQQLIYYINCLVDINRIAKHAGLKDTLYTSKIHRSGSITIFIPKFHPGPVYFSWSTELFLLKVCWKVHRSLPVQCTCAQWSQRGTITTFLLVSSGRFCGKTECLLRPIWSLYNWSMSCFHIPRRKSSTFSVAVFSSGVVFCQQFCFPDFMDRMN